MNYKKIFTILFLLASGCLLADDVANGNLGSDVDTQISNLKTEREQTRLKAEIAGRNADRIMEKDWTEYRHEIERQELLEQKVHELDGQIENLEKKKGEAQKTKSS